jgi:hypothetical protein
LNQQNGEVENCFFAFNQFQLMAGYRRICPRLATMPKILGVAGRQQANEPDELTQVSDSGE